MPGPVLTATSEYPYQRVLLLSHFTEGESEAQVEGHLVVNKAQRLNPHLQNSKVFVLTPGPHYSKTCKFHC